jgi:Putative peptidoglycan binding domain/Domain of unknown function (DUF4347)
MERMPEFLRFVLQAGNPTEDSEMNYTYLHLGDQLPTVGILQKLLNRAGAKLESDGVFGPKTLAAVKHFQKARHLKPDGIVGKDTWPQLVDGLDLPIVDCVDVFDSFQKEEYVRANNKKKADEMADSLAGEVDDIVTAGGKPFVIGGMSNGVDQALTLICAHTKEAFLLRFHGHGYAGSVGIGAGSGGPNQLNRINAGSIPQLRGVIARLHPVFGPYGSIQLMSCHTGQGHDGREMVKQLASIVEVPVTAGIQLQYGGGGGTSTFQLEGPTFTAIPDGQSLKEWCRALPDFN